MECSCSINVSVEDGFDDVISQRMVKANKKHKCTECNRDIIPGETYEQFKGAYDGQIDTYKTCIDCLSLRDHFFDDWCFRGLWEDFENEMSDCGWQVPEKCLSKVTPRTREEICESIEAYWFRQDNPKYSKANCPKPDTWFAEGGKCGWSWCCDDCKDSPDREET